MDRICAAVSVSPMVSMIGTSKRVSKLDWVSTANADEADLPNRMRALQSPDGSGSPDEVSRLRLALNSSLWNRPAARSDPIEASAVAVADCRFGRIYF